jgi:hypothetical protein
MKRVGIEIAGAEKYANLEPMAELPGKSSYFIGSDASQWITDLPTYSQLQYRNIYRGIDLVFYGNRGQIEYDFIVSPSGRTNDIGLRFPANANAKIGESGQLDLEIEGTKLHLLKPTVYQLDEKAERRSIAGNYRLAADPSGLLVKFEVGDYDHSLPLIIDPVLVYSSPINIPGNVAALQSDASGNVYVAWNTSYSAVTKFAPDGQTVIYTATLGASYGGNINSIAVDGNGQAVIGGYIGPGFPTTANAYRQAVASGYHGLLAIINAAGNGLTYSSYFPSSTTDYGYRVGVDSQGNAYLAGQTYGSDFPVTTGVQFTGSTDAFVLKVDPTQSGDKSLVYSTLLPPQYSSSAIAVAVDASFNAYVAVNANNLQTTSGAFDYNGTYSSSGGTYVAKLDANGAVNYIAYLGYGEVRDLAIDGTGNVYVTGRSDNGDFPATTGAYQTTYPYGFVSKLNPTGSALVYSTFLSGPSGLVEPESIAVPAGCGSNCPVYVSGATTATDFPTINAIQTVSGGGSDIFLVGLSGDGASATISSYVGGSTTDDGGRSSYFHIPAATLDAAGNIYIGGNTYSSDFPFTSISNGNYPYLVKISPNSGASLVASTLSYNFGSKTIGVPSKYPIVLKNYGTAPVTILNIASTGDFSQTNDCAGTIAPASSCTLQATFTPTLRSNRYGSITITHNGVNPPVTISMQGYGSDQALLTLTPQNLLFGGQTVNTTSNPLIFTVTNTGSQPATIYSFNSSNPLFAQTNNCPSLLQEGGSCAVSVTFSPLSSDYASGYISISASAAFNGNYYVNVSGIGTGNGNTAAAVSPTDATFPDQVVGTTSAYRLIYFYNIGTVPIQLDAPTTSGDFSMYSSSCGVSLTPGSNCYAYIYFMPTTTGTRTGTLTFPNSASPVTANLSGNGLAPSTGLTVSPSDVQFNDQVVGTISSYQQVRIMNVGNANVSISRAFLNGADFHLQYNGCIATLAPLDSCYLDVQFGPTTTGLRTDTITVINSTGAPQIMNVSGNGLAPSESVYATPQSFTYADTIVGTQSSAEYFYLYNPGNTPVTIASVTSSSPEFLISSNGCTSISPQSYCYIYAYFQPTSLGQKTATFTFTDSAPNSPHIISVGGNAIAATQSVVAQPQTVNFNDQVIGTTSSNQTVYFYNAGNTNVQVSNAAVSGDFVLSYNGCSTLYAGSYCSINVQFAPTAAGQRTGTATIYDNAPGNPHTVQLFGNGLTQNSTVVPSPPGLSFVDTAVGDTSAVQAIYFYNTGNLPVNIASVTISGDFGFNYNGCSGTVYPASYCYMYVQFSPSAPGARTGTVTMTDDANGGQQGASLSGNGLAASKSLSFTTTSLDFGDVLNNTTSNAQGVYVVNSGTQNVQISSVTASAGFTASGCVTTLMPNNYCFINATFSPTATGVITGAITITDTATGSPHLLSVQGNSVAATPAVSVTPPGLSFTPRLMGTTSSNSSLSLVNRTGSPLTVASVSATGDYAVTNNGCSVVSNNSSCTVTLAFIPTATGTRSGTLTFTHNGPNGQSIVNLGGYGIGPAKTGVVTPNAITFTNQVINTSSGVSYSYLYNTGTAPLNIAAPSVTGDFSIQAVGCGTTLAAGSNCYVGVKFTPTAVGPRTGQLTINDDSTTGPHVLSLTGTGIAATNTINVSTSQVNFLAQPVGTTSSFQYVYLYNQGTVPINLGTFSISGDFAINYNACGTTISPSSSCYVRLTFTPTATGARNGSLVLNSDSSSGAQTVLMAGNGVPATKILVVSSTVLQYPDQPVGTASTTQTFYVYNQGTVPVNFTSAYTITGDFSVNYTYCNTSLSPGSSCYFSIVFTPTQVGTRTGALTINDDANGSPHIVSLLGSGTTVNKSARTSANNLSFGNQAVGTTGSQQYVYLYNMGNVPLNLTSATVTGDFSFPYNYCSSGTVSVGSYCYSYVVFTPTATGTRTGMLTFVDDATSSPQTVTLTGVGTTPQATISVSSSGLVFGNQEVNAVSSAQYITITNLSNIPVTFTGVTSDNPELAVNNGCSSFSSVGQTCNFYITFTPAGTGLRTGHIQIASNANGSPMTVTVSGNGVAAGQGPQLSQTNIQFGNQGTGTTSQGVTVYYVNYGSTTVTTGKSTISGDFLQDGGCDQTSFGHNGYCVVTIRFKPSATGTIVGTYSLPDNTTGTPRVINLSGNGVSLAPTVSTFPTVMTFPAQVVGIASAAQPVTVYNTGNAPLVVSTIVANPAGEFSISNGCSTIQPNSSCGFAVTFNPSGTGTRSTTIQINDNATGTPHQIPVTGTGLASAPIASLNTTSLSFNPTATGATASAQNVYLYNTGNAVLSISGIAATGDFSTTGGTCAASLNPNANCYVSVVFSPMLTGTRTGVLTFSDNDASGQQQVALTGTGILPVGAQVTPNSLIFPNQVVNTTSSVQNITLQSTGAALTISAVSASGDFTQTNNCSTLGYNGACSISVKFSPTAVGVRNGTIAISDSAGGHTVTLSGTATGNPAVQLSSASLTFPSTNQGVTSAAQQVSLTNTGNGPLALSTISAGGDFAETNNCGVNLDASSSCTINVTFTPSSFGTITGTLSITDNATGSPHTVALSGTGVAPHAVASATSLTFSAQTVNTTSASQAVTIQNNGNANLTVNTVNVAGIDYGQTNNCGAVAPTGTCTINVTFTPVAAGTRSGTLALTSNGGNLGVALSGTGTGPVASLDKTSLAFGNVNVNTASPPQVVTLSSAGDTALAIAGISITGDYSQANNCPASMAINTSCAITVTFTPSAASTRNGMLTIMDSAANSPQLVSLTGSGFGSSVGFTPPSANFGSVLVNTTSSPQSITIKNAGTANLTIASVTASGDFAQTNNCPALLSPTATCTASVTFTPTTFGARNGSLTVNGNAGSQSAVLSGMGTTQGLTFAPTSLNFGSIPVGLQSGSQNIIVTAVGNLATNISSIVASAGYVQTNNCPVTLQPAGICTITVTFAPTVQASVPGTVTVTSDAPSSPQTIGLTGTGTAPQADLTVTGSANPPRIPLGATASFKFLVTNNGPSTATGTSLSITAPTNGTVNSVTTSSGSCTGTGPISCAIGNLTSGSSAFVTVNVTNVGAGDMTIGGTASANESDPNLADNTLTLTSTSASADLRVIPAITPTTLNDAPAYTMALANDGPSTATNTIMTLNLDRFQYVNAFPSQGTCAYNGIVVTCALGSMSNGGTASVTVAVQAPSSGWATIEVSARSDQFDPNPNNNSAQLTPASDGMNTRLGTNVDVPLTDVQSGAVADVVFNSVSRPGATSLTVAQGSAPPVGYRAGSSSAIFNLNTTAEFSGPVTVVFRYAPSAFKHPAMVRVFHVENGGWVDRTSVVNSTTGTAAAVIASLTQFALYEPLNQAPVANAGSARVVAGASAAGTIVQLDGSASTDPDSDTLTYRWSGPFPEGNGMVTGAKPSITLPFGNSQVTLVVNDGEVDSAPVTAPVTVSDFDVAAQNSSLSVARGSSVTASLALTPRWGSFDREVTLGCANLPASMTCQFSPATITPGANGGTVTLTITSSGVASANTRPANGKGLALWAFALTLPFGLVLVKADHKRNLRNLLLMAVLLLTIYQIGCGGGGGISQSTQPPVNTGTTSTITVTATSGALQHNATLTVTTH